MVTVTTRKLRRVPPLVAVLACCAAQLLVALLVISPWQNPDEPQHVHTVRLVRAYGADFVVEAHWGDPGEREIIESMARHGWWNHYSRPIPQPLPSTFAEGPELVVASYFGAPGGGSRLYYRGVAGLFSIARIDSLLAQLYAMRLLSAVAALFTVWCAWAGTRLLLGDRAAVVVALLFALHPQFLLVSTSASPDALVNFAGAAFWWCAAAITMAGVTARNLVVLWAAGILALLIRRMGAPLLVIAAAVTAISVARLSSTDNRRRIIWATAASLGVVALVGSAWPVLPADLHRAVTWALFDPSPMVATVIARAEQLPAFFDMLFATFWLSAGWLRYPAPWWWQLATFLLTAGVAVGLVTAWRRGPEVARAVWLAAPMVLLQVSVVTIYYFGILQSGPQGRYLFPVLPALLSLVWIGWSSLIGTRDEEPIAARSLIGVMAFLNVTGWSVVILPAYL